MLVRISYNNAITIYYNDNLPRKLQLIVVLQECNKLDAV